MFLILASNESAFTSGFIEHSHMYERLADDEASKSQNGAVTALAHAEAEREVETLIGNVEPKATRGNR